MKTDQELDGKAIFKLEHYTEALYEIDNALLNNSWVKEKKITKILKASTSI